MANISKEKALEIITPFYNLFRTDKRDWESGFDSLTDDWKSFDGNGENAFRTKEQTKEYLTNFFKMIPDINVTNLQVMVDGEWIIVRSELTGTPIGEEFLGEPVTGKPFHIMAIDFNKYNDEGKITQLYHCENWAIAILQVRGVWPW
jgi:predicted ester cyclase